MAQAAKSVSDKKAKQGRRRIRPLRYLLRLLARLGALGFVCLMFFILLFAVVNPPITMTMWKAYGLYGPLSREWVDLDEISPIMARSAVAAEDANFCQHWGFDLDAIRAAMAEGGKRGGSTISQQVVKNVFLWQGRSWLRKALEAVITPMVEAVWSKRRILEMYLNVAETGEGTFGVEAAARRYFAVPAVYLDAEQAALIAAILPSPKTRSAQDPTSFVRRRAASIADGAATIASDGRAACFED